MRAPPASRARESSRREEICSTDSTLVLAAASSMASGIPSRRRHTVVTAGALASVSPKDGATAFALSTKSLTASYRAMSSGVPTPLGSGEESGGTGKILSPPTPKASRLVARITRPAQERSSVPASSAHAPTRCSQLSRTRRISSPPRSSAIASVRERPGTSGTFRTLATACGARSGSETEASSANHAPSSKPSATSKATAEARRVLPVPPGQGKQPRAPGEQAPDFGDLPLAPHEARKLQRRAGRRAGAFVRAGGPDHRPRVGRSVFRRRSWRVWHVCFPRLLFDLRRHCIPSGNVLEATSPSHRTSQNAV